MSTLRLAAQQALDALEVLDRVMQRSPRTEQAIAALRAALAKPEPDQHTHSERCWSWGPKHYECALKHIERLTRERLP